jgi:hypothetical protein
MTAVAPDRVMWISALMLAAAMAFAAPGAPALVVAGVLLAGAASGPQLTALFAIRHRDTPERLRAQVFTTGASLKLTGYAVGAAAVGPLAAWSPPGAMLAAAALAGAAAALHFAIRVAPRQPRRDGARRASEDRRGERRDAEPI